jgi:hypothetical protein
MGDFPNISIAQVESNLPGEDRFSVRATKDVSAFAVFDGHGGYLACDMACATLLDMIITHISATNAEDLTNIRYVRVLTRILFSHFPLITLFPYRIVTHFCRQYRRDHRCSICEGRRKHR